MSKYLIVEYRDGYQLVPNSWVDYSTFSAMWPSQISAKDFVKKVKECIPPDSNWPIYKLKSILGNADTYEKGLEKVKRAAINSDVNTSDDEFLESEKRQRAKENFLRLDDETSIPSTENRKASSDITTYPPFPLMSLPNQNAENNGSSSLISKLPSSKKETDFQKSLKRKLAVISSELRILKETQDVILEEIRANKFLKCSDCCQDDLSNSVEIAFDLPKKTIEDFILLDTSLNDKETEKKLISVLLKIGGKTVKAVVIGILEELLSFEVAKEFSWQGAKKKRCFNELHLSKLIPDVVRMQIANTTDCQIIEVIKNWLRHAPEAYKRQLKKSQSTMLDN